MNKVLKGAFNYAMQEGYCLKNPCQFVSIPKTEIENFDETAEADDEEIEIFDNDTIDKIIHICNSKIKNGTKKYLYYLILLELGSGLRQGEALGLQRKFANTEIKVKKQLIRIKKFKNKKCVGYELKLVPPKTSNSIRDIPLPNATVDIISKYKLLQENNWSQSCKPLTDDTLLFSTNEGKPLDASNLLKQWKSFLRKNGIEYKKWHSLRHSYASLLFQMGADIKTVQELLGHADVNTTAQIYVHVFPETKKNAVNLLNEKLK